MRRNRSGKTNAGRSKRFLISTIYITLKMDFTYSYKTQAGLTEDIVRTISAEKKEPKWMLDFRLKSLDIFHHLEYPVWGPDISELHMDDIVTYVRPNTQMKASWDDVPDDIKDTFDRLGIPEAEKIIPGRRRGPVRFRSCISQHSGRTGAAGRNLHGL